MRVVPLYSMRVASVTGVYVSVSGQRAVRFIGTLIFTISDVCFHKLLHLDHGDKRRYKDFT